MQRVLIFNRGFRTRAAAFTLVEVVVALGVLAVTVVAALGLLGAMGRSANENSETERAGQLVEASLSELARLRDHPVGEGLPGQLDGLAAIIPASDSPASFKLVGSRDGLRAVNETDADDPETGVLPRDRFYLIEVRQQTAPLNYRSDAGFMALSLTVRWPYRIASGPGAADFTAADLSQASVAIFNCALAP